MIYLTGDTLAVNNCSTWLLSTLSKGAPTVDLYDLLRYSMTDGYLICNLKKFTRLPQDFYEVPEQHN
jgi:hypothetical protein